MVQGITSGQQTGLQLDRREQEIRAASGERLIVSLDQADISICDPARNLPNGFDVLDGCIVFHLQQNTRGRTNNLRGRRPDARLQLRNVKAIEDQIIRGLVSALRVKLERMDPKGWPPLGLVDTAYSVNIVYRCVAFGKSDHPVKGGLAPWQERRAKEMMRSSIGSAFALSHIAHRCGLSTSHFSRSFRRSIGMAPYAWLLEQRVERVKNLIDRSPLTLAEVAVACGFADQSHMTKVFKRKVGVSPAAWRREIRAGRDVLRTSSPSL